jgi:hypothetical protein
MKYLLKRWTNPDRNTEEGWMVQGAPFLVMILGAVLVNFIAMWAVAS